MSAEAICAGESPLNDYFPQVFVQVGFVFAYKSPEPSFTEGRNSFYSDRYQQHFG